MKKIFGKLLVLVLTLVMLFSMTSCDMIFAILDAFLSEEYEDPDKREVEVLPDTNSAKDPSNPYSGLHSGYNIIPASADGYIWEVEDCYEVDRVFDYAIANLLESVTIDFSVLASEYSDFATFFKTVYLPNSKKELEHVDEYQWTTEGDVVTFTFKYDSATASYRLPATAENTYENYKNINMLMRDYADGEATRSENFDDFAIEKNNAGEMAVYNSESLWWALEHNYLPVFPAENTKAEAYYEEAKAILRQIINDDMTDYEKTLAIFEYLVDRVDYDYDSYKAIDVYDGNNTCYYLEGVFEYNRAVCDGKSKAFVVLCRIEGIECLRDYGTSPTGGAGHAWNYVKIDGTWYMVDTTAGDAGVAFNGNQSKAEVVDYSFFLCAVNTYKKGYSNGKVYTYSGIWDSTLKNNKNTSDIAKKYYDRCDLGDDLDFVMNSVSELENMIDSAMVIIDGEEGVYSLKLEIVSSIELVEIRYAMDEYTGVEYSVYDSSEEGCYLIVFTVE